MLHSLPFAELFFSVVSNIGYWRNSIFCLHTALLYAHSCVEWQSIYSSMWCHNLSTVLWQSSLDIRKSVCHIVVQILFGDMA